MNEELKRLSDEYSILLDKQKFIEEELDYSILEKYSNLLKYLDELENSSFEIFDLYKRKHIYFSPKFASMLGLEMDKALDETQSDFDSRIHPDDTIELFRSGNYYMNLIYNIKPENRKDFKLFSDFRILNGANEYMRITKQFVALEFDKSGNIWLGLAIINISPDSDISRGVKSRAVNIKSGEIYLMPQTNLLDINKSPLSERELNILELISKGFSSKQIAEKLFISVHTVNTHRQHIIEKLEVGNTQEAVAYLNKFN